MADRVEPGLVSLTALHHRGTQTNRSPMAIIRGVTLNNASDYRTNGHYRTPNHNPSLLVL